MSELYVCKQYEMPYERVCKIITTLDEHDSELLDKIMQKQRTIIDDDGVMYKVVFLKDIEDMKAEIKEVRRK